MTENKSEDTPAKSRGASACIRLGYRLYAGNFKRIFRATWLLALAYAVVCSAALTLTTIELPRAAVELLGEMSRGQVNFNEYLLVVLAIAALAIVGGVAETLFYSSGMALLAGHENYGAIPQAKRLQLFSRPLAWRTVKAALVLLLFFVIISAVVGGAVYVCHSLASAATYTTIAVAGLLLLVLLLLALPVSFVAFKYVMRRETRFWPLLAADYPVALRHFGFIFVVMLVSALVVLAAMFVLAQPAHILATANFQSNIGTLMGDPAGMPPYIGALSAAIFLFAGVVMAYARMSILYTSYYMYGSIEAQEEERKKYKLKVTNYEF